MRFGCGPSVCNSADGPLLPWVTLAIGLAAIGHFLWEAMQLPLYTLRRTGTPSEIAFALFHCTGGDILITTVTVAAAVALARFFAGAPLGGACCSLRSPLALATPFSVNGSMSKSAAAGPIPQPGFPFIGTGLTPLLQWLVVPSLAFAITAQRYRRAR